MSWTKTHDLAVVTGSYTHNGKEKKRYENVGHVMQGDERRLQVRLYAGVLYPD